MGLKEVLERRYKRETQQRKEKLLGALKKIAEDGLLEAHKAKILVFGSLATGEFRPWSDVDLAVIESEEMYVLIGKMLSYFDSEDDVDICVFEMVSPELQKRILEEGIEFHEFVKKASETDF